MTRAGAQTVFEAPAPAFSCPEAEAIARQAFDIEATARLLVSERDQNFQLCANDGSEWVLKIANLPKTRRFWTCRRRRCYILPMPTRV